MSEKEIIGWLLQSDLAITYQVHRDLLNKERKDLQKRIATEGWGARFMKERNANGHWGRGFYPPKWISSHYTLLDLRNLCFPPDASLVKETIDKIIDEEKGPDGGVGPGRSISGSDVCVNGMFLNYACYFGTQEEKLKSVVDFILSQKMKDGGFNCRSNRSGAVHSSLHSTLSVLEGITEFEFNSYSYRIHELKNAEASAKEFILQHQLFLSDRTGEIIHKDFIKLSYPGRWRYDILRALDYFRYSNTPWDKRMEPAIEVLLNKRNKDGSWNVQAHHPGQVHFVMEKAGKPSRWNTLRSLRVLKKFKIL